MIGDFISLASGFVLFVVAVLVMIAYRPKRGGDRATWLLSVAIFLSFFADAANTLYWQVFGQIAVVWFDYSVASLRWWGDYFDLLFKGGAAVAGIMHLMALHERLPESEKKRWHTLEMPWYPARRTCLTMIFRRDK